MRLPQDGERRDRSPRLHHWLLAGVPLFAAFI